MLALPLGQYSGIPDNRRIVPHVEFRTHDLLGSWITTPDAVPVALGFLQGRSQGEHWVQVLPPFGNQ